MRLRFTDELRFEAVIWACPTSAGLRSRASASQSLNLSPISGVCTGVLGVVCASCVLSMGGCVCGCVCLCVHKCVYTVRKPTLGLCLGWTEELHGFLKCGALEYL